MLSLLTEPSLFSAAARKEHPNAPAADFWLTEADINKNLRDFEGLFAKVPSNGNGRPAAQVLGKTVPYTRFQKHQHLHVCLWALRQHPQLVCSIKSLFLFVFLPS